MHRALIGSKSTSLKEFLTLGNNSKSVRTFFFTKPQLNIVARWKPWRVQG